MALQGDRSQEKACFNSLGRQWIKKFYKMFESAVQRQDQIGALGGIHNIAFGGTSKVLQTLIDGTKKSTSELRAIALWSAMPEVLLII